MSTRATYEFRSANQYLIDVTVCFYIHTDGYPKGAADYFYAMHDTTRRDNQQDYAAQFFRMNENAEFTQNRDWHSDTDYHYIFSHNDTLLAFQREKNNSWVSIYEGKWLDFVNQHQKFSRKLYHFDVNFTCPSEQTMTLNDAHAMIDAKREEVRALEEESETDAAAWLRDDVGYLKGQLRLIEKSIEND